MVKPGYRTSEFWFTMVSFIFSGLYLMGLIGENSQKEDLIQETSRGLEATILIIGQLTVLFKYIKGRTDLKKTWWDTATPEERKIANKANSRRKKKTTKKKPSTEITDQSLT
jgi:hypothetical protein